MFFSTIFLIIFFRNVSVFYDLIIHQLSSIVNTFFRINFTFTELYVIIISKQGRTVTFVSFTYQPLWDMLEDKGISKMEFAKQIDISSTTLAKLSKNEPITLSTIDKICNKYHCKIEDIVRHIQDVDTENIDSMDMLRVGTIIQIDSFNDDSTPSLVRNRPFVVVNTHLTTYYIAPVISSPRRFFALRITFANSTNMRRGAWIDFSRTMPLPTNAIVKVISQLDSNCIEAINKLFTTSAEILHESDK